MQFQQVYKHTDIESCSIGCYQNISLNRFVHPVPHQTLIYFHRLFSVLQPDSKPKPGRFAQFGEEDPLEWASLASPSPSAKKAASRAQQSSSSSTPASSMKPSLLFSPSGQHAASSSAFPSPAPRSKSGAQQFVVPFSGVAESLSASSASYHQASTRAPKPTLPSSTFSFAAPPAPTQRRQKSAPQPAPASSSSSAFPQSAAPSHLDPSAAHAHVFGGDRWGNAFHGGGDASELTYATLPVDVDPRSPAATRTPVGWAAMRSPFNFSGPAGGSSGSAQQNQQQQQAAAQAPNPPMSPHARQLSVASSLFKRGLITADEKAACKDAIIHNDRSAIDLMLAANDGNARAVDALRQHVQIAVIRQ
jgi:hypothetical protein